MNKVNEVKRRKTVGIVKPHIFYENGCWRSLQHTKCFGTWIHDINFPNCAKRKGKQSWI